jgi:RNA polymerase sigma-70 factor, ECF subfamily
MQQIARQDRIAFRTLLERHSRRMIALAQNTLGVAAEAEEVVQEAFIRVWSSAAKFEPGRAQFTTWMHRIVLNLCIDRVRKPHAAGNGDELPDLEDESPDALGQALAKERRAAVQQAMRRLPVRQRAALALFHFQELSARDCAAAMEVSESAFESLLIRARIALREQLQPFIHPGGSIDG